MIKVMVVTTKGNSPFSDILEATTNALEVTQLEKLKQSLGIDKIIGKIYDHEEKIDKQEEKNDKQEVKLSF